MGLKPIPFRRPDHEPMKHMALFGIHLGQNDSLVSDIFPIEPGDLPPSSIVGIQCFQLFPQIFSSIFVGSILYVSISGSTKTGVRRLWDIARMVAI